MLLTLTTNCCTRIVNLHSSFFDKPELLHDKVKSLSRDLAIGQKIKNVTVEKDGNIIYSFSSGLPKDFEKHSASESQGFGVRPNSPKYVSENHLRSAGKINFLRS